MSTYFQDIRAALEARLNTLSSVPPVWNENVRYEQQSTTTYLRAFVLFGDSVQASLGTSGKDRTDGVFQVDVMTPHGVGQTTWPDLIADHFKRGTDLTQNSVTLTTRSVSIAPGFKDDHFYIVPVSVSWYVYTAARS